MASFECYELYRFCHRTSQIAILNSASPAASHVAYTVIQIALNGTFNLLLFSTRSNKNASKGNSPGDMTYDKSILIFPYPSTFI